MSNPMTKDRITELRTRTKSLGHGGFAVDPKELMECLDEIERANAEIGELSQARFKLNKALNERTSAILE